MKNKQRPKAHRRTRPSISGVGLVALDHVTNSGGKRLHSQAGGTCGNVLAILAALGWDSSPIARLRTCETAGKLVLSDLERFGVNTRWLGLIPQTSTPVIIEKLLRDSSGVPFHCFSFYCPGCGARLPRYQPVPLAPLREVIDEACRADVVFIDRVSPGAFALAEKAHSTKALVFFEPSCATAERDLRRILPHTNVLKYSHERMQEALEPLPESVTLEIQTLGRGGLRFRSRSHETRQMEPWCHLESFPATDVIDSAGAGDWLSAAIIHLLFSTGLKGLLKLDRTKLVTALSKAQRLASWSCTFVGARGGMYYSESGTIQKILSSAAMTWPHSTDGSTAVADSRLLCEGCAGHRPSSPRERIANTLPRMH